MDNTDNSADAVDQHFNFVCFVYNVYMSDVCCVSNMGVAALI